MNPQGVYKDKSTCPSVINENEFPFSIKEHNNKKEWKMQGVGGWVEGSFQVAPIDWT